MTSRKKTLMKGSKEKEISYFLIIPIKMPNEPNTWKDDDICIYSVTHRGCEELPLTSEE
jgi:hypothetical protein